MGHDEIKLFILDSRPVIRRGLQSIFRAECGIHVAGDASSLDELLQACVRTSLDVVVMELMWPYAASCDAIETIIRETGAKCIAFTDQEDWALVSMWLQAGGSGYLTKQSSETEIVKAIKHVAAGGTFLSPQLGKPKRTADTTAEIPLSKREVEVVALVATGHTASKIAEVLNISTKTIETYRSRIARKLGLRNRTQLVQYAAEHGLLKMDGWRNADAPH